MAARQSTERRKTSVLDLACLYKDDYQTRHRACDTTDKLYGKIVREREILIMMEKEESWKVPAQQK